MPDWLGRARARRLVRAGVCGVGVGAAVAGLALVGRERVDAVLELDEKGITAATDLTRAHPALLRGLLVWQEALQPISVYIAATGVCVWVWRRHRLTTRAAWAFVTMMLAWNLALDVKYLVGRARPVLQDAVSHAPGYSFPSGHATNSAAAGTVLLLLGWPILKEHASPPTRYAVLAAVVLIVLLTAADRVFLGVHYPSDVVGGVLLGCGLAIASYLGYLGWNPPRTDPDPEA